MGDLIEVHNGISRVRHPYLRYRAMRGLKHHVGSGIQGHRNHGIDKRSVRDDHRWGGSIVGGDGSKSVARALT
jgi:hypothetical protein